MSDTDNKPTLGRKPLGLKKSVEAGEVKQTFSHGRTNKVVVEVKRRKILKPGSEGAEATPVVEEAAPPPPPPKPAPKKPSAPAETPQERVARLQREAEEGAAEIVDCVLDREMLRVIVHTRAKAPCIADVTGGDDAVVAFLIRDAAAQVTRELIAHEFIIRQIAIERRDDPVAVAAHLRNGIVRVITRCVRVTHHIQPVTAPALAISRRIKESIDYLGESVVGLIREECIYLLRRRRQPG